MSSKASDQTQIIRTSVGVLDEDAHRQPLSNLYLGNALLKWHSMILLDLGDMKVAHTLRLGKRSIVGRGGAQSACPDIDLVHYEAQALGVSRHHAAFYLMKNIVYVVDLSSTNGTYLNAQRLLPNQPRIVRDGDEIYLGQLRFAVRFG